MQDTNSKINLVIVSWLLVIPVLRTGSFDLHALSTPPAFILSQDQTLNIKLSRNSLNRSSTNPSAKKANWRVKRFNKSLGLTFECETTTKNQIFLRKICPERSRGTSLELFSQLTGSVFKLLSNKNNHLYFFIPWSPQAILRDLFKMHKWSFLISFQSARFYKRCFVKVDFSLNG